MIIVIIIGTLAALAVSQYQKYSVQSLLYKDLQPEIKWLEQRLSEYRLQTTRLPADLADIGLDQLPLNYSSQSILRQLDAQLSLGEEDSVESLSFQFDLKDQNISSVLKGKQIVYDAELGRGGQVILRLNQENTNLNVAVPEFR